MRPLHHPTRPQWALAGLILALAVGVVAVRVVKGVGLGQTAAFYIGIPTVFALVLALSTPAKSLVGMTMRAITIALLLAMPALGEGFVCVLVAAPLCYAVGLLVALLIGWARRIDGPRAPAFVAPAVLLLMSCEGVTPATTLPDQQSVSATRQVAATPEQVQAAVARPLRFADRQPGGLLALGFPRPLSDAGSGLGVGDRRTVTFSGAHHRPPGMTAHHWGEHSTELVLRVVDRTADSVTFETVSDNTPLATWLGWQRSRLSWRAVASGGTELTWTLGFTRRLAPAWYFGPLEQVVATEAAGYLLDAIDLDPAVPQR
ncbi:MAG: hypothetical protein U0R77_10985 [Mycolicibacterium insubricum]|nr:hypothetical protein [Mycobacterium sp.]